MQETVRVKLETMARLIVTELVDKPEEASVAAALSSDGQIITVTVKTADGEQGKVIGRQGSHAQATRTLLEAVAAKHKLRAVLEIADARPKRRRGSDRGRENMDRR
jgi:predicted RNA-binding protein YlqC (UPF0109 family)